MTSSEEDKFLEELIGDSGATWTGDFYRIDPADLMALVRTAYLKGSVTSSPGRPPARFTYLMDQLEKRLHDPEPFSARAPEERFLALIDKLLSGSAERSEVRSQSLKELISHRST